MSELVNFAALTIFARECLEASIIIGEYRTIISRGDSLAPGLSKDEALSEITLATMFAIAFALIVIAALAIPLALLSTIFDPSTAYIIEGISKIVAAISLLQLSLEIPKFFGIYGSSKRKKDRNGDADEEREEVENHHGKLTKRNIRFNVAWNIWREVAECGIFLLPFFLAGKEDLKAIPLSAVIGSIVGLVLGYGIYVANHQLKNKVYLTIFAVLLLVILSAGLFAGGCHKMEGELGSTKLVWKIEDDFFSVNRLPMTVIKPFGYNDSRTVLEIVCYWSWLAISAAFHYRKYKISPKISGEAHSAVTTLEKKRQETMETSVADVETLEASEQTGTVEGSDQRTTKFGAQSDEENRIAL